MINVEPCRGCGRTLYTAKVANLDVRCEVEPLDAQTAVAALAAGRELWTAAADGLHPARTTELSTLAGRTVVATHRCTAVSRPPRTPEVPSRPKALPSSPAGRQTPSWGQSTGYSTPDSASSAVKSRIEGPQEPVCDRCSRPVTPGTYWGFQHGDRWVYAEHAERCPAFDADACPTD